MKFFKRLFESAYKTPFHSLRLIPAVLFSYSVSLSNNFCIRQEYMYLYFSVLVTCTSISLAALPVAQRSGGR